MADEVDFNDLEIRPVDDNAKDRIEQPKLSNDNIIPRLNTSNIIVGTTGMGKSTLLQNLMTRKNFYGGTRKDGKPFFDAVILISPTGANDDVQKALKLKDVSIVKNLKEAEAVLNALSSHQHAEIEEKGADKALQVGVILDDVISDKIFMNSEAAKNTFIANRHKNFTVFLCTQSWTKVPRVMRLQCRGIFYFAGSISECDLLCDEYCPPGLSRADFKRVIEYATQDEFSFLFINKSAHIEERFRKNLGEIINLNYFKNSKKNPNFKLPAPKKMKKKAKKKKDKEKEKDDTDAGKRKRHGDDVGVPIGSRQRGAPQTIQEFSGLGNQNENFEQLGKRRAVSRSRSKFQKRQKQAQYFV